MSPGRGQLRLCSCVIDVYPAPRVPETLRYGDRHPQMLESHHIKDTGSCGTSTSTSNEHALILMSHVSLWHPQPLFMCIYLETVIPFVCFLLTQTVICLVYAPLNYSQFSLLCWNTNVLIYRQ